MSELLCGVFFSTLISTCNHAHSDNQLSQAPLTACLWTGHGNILIACKLHKERAQADGAREPSTLICIFKM